MSTYKVHCVDCCLLDNFAWPSSQQSCPCLHEPYFPSCGSTCSLHSLQKVVFFPLPWLVKYPLLNLAGSPALCFVSQRELGRGFFCIFLLIYKTSPGELRSLHVSTPYLQPEAFNLHLSQWCWANFPTSQFLQEEAQIVWCGKELDFSQPLWLDFPLLTTFRSHKTFASFLITFDELIPWVHTEAQFKNHLFSVASLERD